MAAKLSGPSGGSNGGVEQNSEINVTPFVDVMLVLLIIFMVAAPLATVSIEVDLPPAVAPPVENPPKPVYLSIQEGGQLFIGDKPTDLGRLPEDMRINIGTRNPEQERIFIRGDGEMVYRDFMDVMNTLQDSGFYSVALVGQDTSTGS